MSSSPTEPTSTTASSTNSPSESSDRSSSGPSRVALIACGAIAQPAADAVARRGWAIDVHPLPPLLHNRPEKIAGEVADLAATLLPAYSQVVVGYADCGTYGALDRVCDDLGLDRLPGLHCYDVYAGSREIRSLMEEQPGTYLLTDFLVRSFARTVERELGLDRFPELLIDEKTQLLDDLVSRGGRLFFTHDPNCAVAALRRDDKGQVVGVLECRELATC